ncbi:hypothetical protein DOTSEDRAFT_57741 [Dothistroma septosporum NZE10]|uniref:DUF985 domain-containing protein n=1 Tax=Dothistroma septosporum (strain NZE10 / CBS 128990) TaxID=675120 RepID=N1PY50_DOTSN|nr:hypothetical protein DOTSEDRAFT_57741 [Dothistroma septosporum NZE10]
MITTASHTKQQQVTISPSDIPEPPTISALIHKLSLQPHPEGGHFVETDRSSHKVAAPWDPESRPTHADSTTIHYLLTPASPLGHFHRNRARTIHTLHKGRGRYVIIHADEEKRWTGKARIETFIVGQDVLKGERVQWIVEGGKYKCSYLLPDVEGGEGSEGLLISETVVPGFEFGDHDFLTDGRMKMLVGGEQAREMGWMLRRGK